ncbi:TLR cluster1 member 26 [Biomphalaria glabrata]
MPMTYKSIEPTRLQMLQRLDPICFKFVFIAILTYKTVSLTACSPRTSLLTDATNPCDLIDVSGKTVVNCSGRESNHLNLFKLPVDLFRDLINLTDLMLAQYVKYGKFQQSNVYTLSNKSFPDAMFRYLVNLQILSVSSSSNILYFNEGFAKLPYLRELHISGTFSRIEDHSFLNVRSVTDLYLVICPVINFFSEAALAAFKSLRSIQYQMLDLGLHKALGTLRPLVNTNLTTVLFFQTRRNTFNYLSIENGDGILNATDTEFLRQICLEELVFNNNHIFILESGALFSPTFNRCLKKLYIFEKNFIGSNRASFEIFLLQNLREIFIAHSVITRNMQNNVRKVFKLINAFDNFTLDASYQENIFTPYYQLFSKQNSPLPFEFKFSKNTYSERGSQSTEITIVISDSLEYIELTSLAYGLYLNVPVKIKGGENLISANLRNNGIHQFLIPIEGLPKLRELYLSFNDVSIVSRDILDSYPNLEILYLDNCNLSSAVMSEYSHRFFRRLVNLTKLDLSYNALDLFSTVSFLNNRKLAYLNLAGNRFNDIPFDFKLTPELRYLDMRQNVVTAVSKRDRDIMEDNRERLGSFQLFLADNILSCGCEHIDFLQWLQLTSVQLDNNSNFTCINSEGVLTYTLLYLQLEDLWRQCWGRWFFNFSFILLFVIVIGHLLVFLWVKNKTVIISNVFQFFTNLRLKKVTDYRYGVFIGYCNCDYQFACVTLREYIEEKLKLTTFLQDRDLLPSSAVSDGIMEAMTSSYRILLVVNESFVKQNDWFLFTVRSAVYSVTPNNTFRVVIIVEEAQVKKLPTELFNCIPEDNVIRINEWLLDYKLKESLRTRLQ